MVKPKELASVKVKGFERIMQEGTSLWKVQIDKCTFFIWISVIK